MAKALKETELYITYEKVMNQLYRLEDITQYENEVIGKAINELQKLDIEKIAEKIYLVVKDK